MKETLCDSGEGTLMGVTLVFELKGVNWPYVFIYNNWNRLISKMNSRWGDPHAGATLRAAWGYGEQALEYKPKIGSTPLPILLH
ncbi:hypothetical protein BR63_12155 [Thermanaerosceptrum fracticalcis]|uniref:Uncharacterized protein n=1 Tax=Thermanaerosceptrum fracticalcis TaxID=1712410 RepID=A0A7G6E4I9_THEFR|nr:hypothetical protein [Thermanaerosceptrum fracticalcis]QNB46993.1 hypothetical protein BR63_12155 [Thermanaerosceptrum fracticalcis]